MVDFTICHPLSPLQIANSNLPRGSVHAPVVSGAGKLAEEVAQGRFGGGIMLNWGQLVAGKVNLVSSSARWDINLLPGLELAL